MPVVRGGGAMAPKESAALLEGRQVAFEAAAILAGHLAQATQVARELGTFRIDDIVGPKGGDDTAFPAGGRNARMILERIERRLGGRQQLDIEAFEQRARPESGRGERRIDGVEI